MNITATLLGQIFTFAVLVWFVNRFLWGPMTQMMADRRKRITDGLAAAERGKHELELAEKKAVERLREAKQQSADVIAQANKRANEIIEESKDTGRQEGQRQLDAAQVEIEQEINRAKTHLREEFAEIVLEGVHKILEKEVNAKAHGEFINKLAQKI
ncbi:F0F1 ATP synthase subunit B [Candidatus Venteria ishoeyi]|uniref:ATP synthase subunit b n=1 Tax=Candidatus Venteria ishoeyi TaxID=1899563 RepID=A0A1H6FGE3_9GAMM|nr:F0F1 ATP synthase subunit B [Candidatus Venteria ishoeyi]MDM8547371.1 F0F1 ATP synthase subunit B [Candidatus Venteria ishoeyi]SEH08723.1 ATP synthase subunit b [Candidatus Venteria ishoeyi]